MSKREKDKKTNNNGLYIYIYKFFIKQNNFKHSSSNENKYHKAAFKRFENMSIS